MLNLILMLRNKLCKSWPQSSILVSESAPPIALFKALNSFFLEFLVEHPRYVTQMRNDL